VALYCTMIGGWMPAGNTTRTALVAATICEMARSRLTSGWKYIFCTETPLRVCASMSLMPVTLVLIEY
jgi:hypothetical protein